MHVVTELKSHVFFLTGAFTKEDGTLHKSEFHMMGPTERRRRSARTPSLDRGRRARLAWRNGGGLTFNVVSSLTPRPCPWGPVMSKWHPK